MGGAGDTDPGRDQCHADGGYANLLYGQSTVVHIMAQGTAAGLFSLAGDILASGPTGTLVSTDPMTFNANFDPSGMMFPKPGLPGANGGWTNFGTEQTNWFSPDNTLYKAALGEVCTTP